MPPFESLVVSSGDSEVTPVNSLARSPIKPVIGANSSTENVRPAFGPLVIVPVRLPGSVVKVKVPSAFTVYLKVKV